MNPRRRVDAMGQQVLSFDDKKFSYFKNRAGIWSVDVVEERMA